MTIPRSHRPGFLKPGLWDRGMVTDVYGQKCVWGKKWKKNWSVRPWYGHWRVNETLTREDKKYASIQILDSWLVILKHPLHAQGRLVYFCLDHLFGCTDILSRHLDCLLGRLNTTNPTGLFVSKPPTPKILDFVCFFCFFFDSWHIIFNNSSIWSQKHTCRRVDKDIWNNIFFLCGGGRQPLKVPTLRSINYGMFLPHLQIQFFSKFC